MSMSIAIRDTSGYYEPYDGGFWVCTSSGQRLAKYDVARNITESENGTKTSGNLLLAYLYAHEGITLK